mmetsp:Transcript_80238/g.117620  ORF Transcript_80238/g.117620 Transcript_80238/m.117620 type:complete len:115 (+) Transcript_80238:414-758(+)
MPNATSFVTYKVKSGKLEEMTTWLHSKNAEFTAWPGLKSMTFAKLDDTTIKSSVVYASLKDLEANQANFEAAVAELKGMLQCAPVREFGEVFFDCYPKELPRSNSEENLVPASF